jgi:NAD(P)H-hydrate epimerase
MHVCTPDEMREIEAKTDASGHSYDEMMRMAGTAVADNVAERVPPRKSVVVLCGPGNNGGDGLVAGAELALRDYNVRAYLWRRKPADIPPPADEKGISMMEMAEEASDGDHSTLQEWLAEADVILDALRGTGGGREIKSPLADILAATAEELEREDAPLYVAVDSSTGVNLTDGSVDPATVPADVTVTFGYPKVGQLRFPGANFVGELIVADIGMPEEFATGQLFMATDWEVADSLPERPMDAHKGTFGKALVIAGSVNYTGAAFLSAAAAYRSGAGLVTAAIVSSAHPIIAGLLPEATFLVLPEDLGVISRAAVEVVGEAWSDYQAVLVGPGLTRQKPTAEFLRELLRAHHDGSQEHAARHEAIGFDAIISESSSHGIARQQSAGEEDVQGAGTEVGSEAGAKAAEDAAKRGQEGGGASGGQLDSSNKPPARFVVDADGLNLLSEMREAMAQLPPETVLTPHPGEMARLTGLSTRQVNENREQTAAEWAAEWGHVVVLKGALTVVAAPDGRVTIIPIADSALAVAGTGDVLSGAIVGLLAQGMAPYEAAVAGAYMHALAGQMAGEAFGSRGTVAGDVLRQLPWALMEIEQE